jgi:hypothetical protein
MNAPDVLLQFFNSLVQAVRTQDAAQLENLLQFNNPPLLTAIRSVFP